MKIKCRTCEKSFSVSNHQGTVRQYCSDQCRNIARKRYSRKYYKDVIVGLGKQKEYDKKRGLKRSEDRRIASTRVGKCEGCGNTFITRSSVKRFCSNLCREKSWNARTGRTSSSNKNRRYRELKGNKCQLCGWDKAFCDVHHIVPKSEGGLNKESNLIILCPNCHRLCHEGIIEVKEPYISKGDQYGLVS